MPETNEGEAQAPPINRSAQKAWPTVCSIPKLVKLLGGAISESSLYERAKQGSLPGCRRIGHRLLVHVPTFMEWLQSGTGDEKEPSKGV